MISKNRSNNELKRKREYFDSEKEIEEKVTGLSEVIENKKHFVVFTGACKNTSEGIPDFRKDMILS
jgi:NAD-dependent protein deacetylases, SIR2 family